MPTFFFHYREPGLYRSDPEGEEQPNLAAAIGSAVLGAREIIAGRIKHEGIWISDARFEIADEAGTVLAVLPFAETVDRR